MLKNFSLYVNSMKMSFVFYKKIYIGFFVISVIFFVGPWLFNHVWYKFFWDYYVFLEYNFIYSFLDKENFRLICTLMGHLFFNVACYVYMNYFILFECSFASLFNFFVDAAAFFDIPFFFPFFYQEILAYICLFFSFFKGMFCFYFSFFKFVWFQLAYFVCVDNFFFCIFSSFLSFFVIYGFSTFLGLFGCLFLVFFNMISSLVILFNIFVFFLSNSGFLIFMTDINLLSMPFFDIQWSFLCDQVTCVMLCVVLSISFIVNMYSIIYMRYDPQLIRFLSLLSLFTFCMLLLVSGVNLIQIFLGWEGVGICSYLLVNFWFTRVQANKAAIKAMLLNRVGDISFLFFISVFFFIFRTFDFLLILPVYETYKYAYLNFYFFHLHLYSFLSFFLVVAAVGKSAQLGLHTWLPDAMEGPTPVSALIHAATMVTAGVFVLIRLYFILDLSLIKFIIFFFGCLTALFGSVVAFVQNDLKKVIAYSTCSQLGYMVVACALGHYDLALFHLFNHAFFKALLFLSAGVVLHSILDEQDMRKMGGLLNFLPFTYCCLLLASYALMGLPFLAGFYSKDLILEIAFFNFVFSGFFSFCLILAAAFFTALYSFRLLFLVFYQAPKGSFKAYSQAHEGHLFMLVGFGCLAFLSLFSGYFFCDLFLGVGSVFFGFNFRPLCFNNMVDFEFVYFFYKLLPFFFSMFGLFCGYAYNFIRVELYFNSFFKKVLEFVSNKWFFDFIFNKLIVLNVFKFSYNISYKIIDKNFLELYGVNAVSFFFFKVSFFYSYVYNTYIFAYIALLFFAFVFAVGLYMFHYNILFILFLNIVYVVLYYFFNFYNPKKKLYENYKK